MAKEIINSNEAPAPLGPYNQAVRTGDILFVSGQIPLNAETSELVLDSIESQTKEVMKNVGAVLKEAGLDYSNIVKTSIFLKDMNDFVKVNGIYAEYFGDDSPARECVEVARLPKDVGIEISVIATF